MNYDKSSFLAGLAIGQQLKGWANARSWIGAPFHKWVIEGKVINRDINRWEVVHAIPQQGNKIRNSFSGWFVDENNRGYYIDRQDKLCIYDETTGALIDNTETVIGSSVDVEASGQFGYFLGADRTDVQVICRDGRRITCTLPVAHYPGGSFELGYRNGIIAIAAAYGGTYTYRCHTYDMEGNLLHSMIAGQSGLAYEVIPITASRVAVIENYSVGWLQRSYQRFVYQTPSTRTNKGFMWGSYYPENDNRGSGNVYMGHDDEWMYCSDRLQDPGGSGTLLDECVLAKFNLFDYDGPVELDRFDPSISYGCLHANGHIAKKVSGVSYEIVSFPSMEPVYDFVDAYTDGSQYFYENDDYLFFVGVYQYEPNTGVIWADDTYPRAPSDDQLGYVSAPYKVGQLGRAYILFTQEEEEP